MVLGNMLFCGLAALRISISTGDEFPIPLVNYFVGDPWSSIKRFHAITKIKKPQDNEWYMSQYEGKCV